MCCCLVSSRPKDLTMNSVLKQFRKKLETGEIKNNSPAPSRKTGLVEQKKNDSVLSASIEEDIKSLKSINSQTQRSQIKREQLIPKYKDRVKQLQDAGDNKSEILGYYLVWLFDAEMMDDAMAFADYCINKNVKLPERFARDTQTFIADAIYAWSNKQFIAGASSSPYFDTYLEKVINAEIDVSVDLAGKYYALAAFILEKNDDLEAALKMYEMAMDLGTKVQTKYNKLQKRMEKEGLTV